MSPVQIHAKHTIEYLEQDLISYQAVFNDAKLRGKLGVGMITNVVAALDSFAWLLYQTLDQKFSTGDLFKRLISDPRFFATADFINEKLLYGIVRCGVVHQFYPKNISIVVLDRNEIFLQFNGEPVVNALGLYKKALDGLRKVCDYVLTLSGNDLDEMDFKLELRRRIDEKQLEGASLNVLTLPRV